MNTPIPVNPPSPALGINNIATYAGALAAGGIFYWLGTQQVFLPAGSEAALAGIFAAVIGHFAGRLVTGGKS